MRVERARGGRVEGSPDVAVVIDVLRATSTAVALLGRGLPEIRVAQDPAAVGALPSRDGGYLVLSELSQLAEGPHRIDNSPVSAREVPLEGRLPVLVTTNGTRALVAASERARTVVTASFLNLRAVVALLRAQGGSVALVPSGDFKSGTPHAEDEACADALEALLRGEEPPLPELLARCRAEARVARRMAAEPGLHRDVDLCLSVDLYALVPRFAYDGGGLGWLRVTRS